MAYKKSIDHIKYGAPGEAKEVRTPDQQLENNIQYLKNLIESALMGQALFYRDVTVESATVVGSPVFWNDTTQQFERALAATKNDTSTGTLTTDESADVTGVVYSKTNNTLADLLVLGVAPLDISAVVDGSPTAGRYYLSSAEAGKLVDQAPPASVPVLFNFGNGNVMITPQLRDFLNDHVHFLFELTAEPAGDHTPPAPGGTHTITNPDSSKKGWLPASHGSFGGKAPAGAAFGYNLSAHSELSKLWPPIPVEAARVEIVRVETGDDELTGFETVPPELIVMDRYGIWWMSDCYDQIPWPNETFPSTGSSSAAACPVTPSMRIYLSYIRMTYMTKNTVVTSLRSNSTAIEIKDLDNNAASVGDLALNFNLSWVQTDASILGADVIKEFDDSTGQLKRGVVTEGLLPGLNVTLSSSTTRLLDPSDSSSPTVYQGIVTIDSDIDPIGRELPIELYRLDDARLRFTGVVAYLAFLESQESSVVGKIHVPANSLPSTPYVKLRATLYNEVTGTPPPVALTYTTLPRPTSPMSLPSSSTSLTFDVPSIGSVTADNYFEVESAALSVTAGDTLFFDMTRSGSDGYAGELGLIRLVAVLQSGP